MSLDPKPTFTDRLRVLFKGVLDAVGGFLNRTGLTPNTVTLLGLGGTAIGALMLGLGHIQLGGFLVLLFVLVDALDGTMARLRGEAGDFGAFVDSVSDRYAEFMTFGGLLYYFVSQQNNAAVLVTFAATAGSVLVSYVKARAEGLAYKANVGLLTRVERYFVLIPLLILGQPFAAVALIAVIGNVTALQRILHVRAQARARAQKNKTYLQ